jgi:hypothetical protein
VPVPDVPELVVPEVPEPAVPVPVVPEVPEVPVVPVVPVVPELEVPLDVAPEDELPLVSPLELPAELHAARPSAIRLATSTPRYAFMVFSLRWWLMPSWRGERAFKIG